MPAKKKSTKMMVIRPGAPIEVQMVAGFEDIQKIVGGYIERVTIRLGVRSADVWVDEDGLSKGLVPNIQYGPHTLVGTVVVGRGTDLTDAEIADYTARLERL